VATGMSAQEMQAFLGRTGPALVGVVGTLRESGAPHVVPVWYRWDGEAVRIWSDEERAWVRNAKRDPRVAFSVQEVTPPFAAVVMHGRAEFSREDPEVSQEIRRITQRYLSEEEVEEYVARWPHLHGIVTIRPEAVHAWAVGY
jgi:PPOX class probable F420-dependent enzyme